MTRRIVRQPHRSTYPNPIHFRRGERLGLGRRDDQYPGWVWTQTPDGNAGWAPLELLEIDADGENAQAMADYSARELDTEQDEVVTVMQQLNGWGWVVRANGESGWVPLETLGS